MCLESCFERLRKLAKSCVEAPSLQLEMGSGWISLFSFTHRRVFWAGLLMTHKTKKLKWNTLWVCVSSYPFWQHHVIRCFWKHCPLIVYHESNNSRIVLQVYFNNWTICPIIGLQEFNMLQEIFILNHFGVHLTHTNGSESPKKPSRTPLMADDIGAERKRLEGWERPWNIHRWVENIQRMLVPLPSVFQTPGCWMVQNIKKTKLKCRLSKWMQIDDL